MCIDHALHAGLGANHAVWHSKQAASNDQRKSLWDNAMRAKHGQLNDHRQSRGFASVNYLN